MKRPGYKDDRRFFCPRGPGPDSPFKPPFNGEAGWRSDDTCSYCGSLDPEVFFARVEAGDVRVVPTDKSYKVYLENEGGEPFKQTYRSCPLGGERHGPDECDHWVTRDMQTTKFYLQHLDEAGRQRFIELSNGGQMQMGRPGYFYVTPFFCREAG